MNALATTEISFDSMRDNGMVTLHAMPSPEGGPVILIFEPVGTDPSATGENVLATAATLSQAGTILASFKAVASASLRNAPDWWTRSHAHKAQHLLDLPQLESSDDLYKAFGLFYLACWKISWDVLKFKLPEDLRPAFMGDHFSSRGYFQVVHAGLLNHVERTFFHRSIPNDKHKKEILEEKHVVPTLCHPHGIHPLSTLLAGMGYQPEITDRPSYLDFPYIQDDPVNSVAHLTTLYWAARNRDPRLDPFRL